MPHVILAAVKSPTNYRLRELTALVGLEARTIRSYIQQAVIPGPDRRGRNARYGPHHLDRLRAVAFLRNRRGLSLPAIRSLLLLLSEDQIRALPKRKGVLDAIMDPVGRSGANPIDRVDWRTSYPSAAPPPGKVAEEARSYHYWWAARPRRQATAFDRLLAHLEQSIPVERVPRAATGESWVRISITPDVELSVRNVSGPEAMGALTRIADHVRYMLLHSIQPRKKLNLHEEHENTEDEEVDDTEPS
jgi:DNA-binding transcriptional MerR regulator